MKTDALFYPHISLNNSPLIKSMSLYYENIYRIVPDDVVPEDSADLHALLEEGSVGRKILPNEYSRKASEEFLSKLNDWDADALYYNYGEMDRDATSKLHKDKTDERVKQLFRDAGFEEDSDWLYVPKEFSSNFMLYMANHIASNNNLSLITNDWPAWTGTSYFGLDGQIDSLLTIGIQGDQAEQLECFSLYGIMINELVPINIADIPAEKILDFRERRKGEIQQFRKCISELRNEICKIESNELRIDAIRDKAKDLERAQKQFKASADLLKAKGWFGVSMMGVPAPMVLAQLLSLPSVSTIALSGAGIAIGSLFNIENTKEELRKLREKTPESLIYDLRKEFKQYTGSRGGGDMNFHAYNCMEEYIND
jgi:Family of unknown function (DUF6236)